MIDQYEKISCNGCKLCKDICPVGAITYSVDSSGFWYPTVDYDKCISCNKCIQKCPNKSNIAIKKRTPKVKAAWSVDDKVRLASTSGGVFYELARDVLNDGGYVSGCVYNSDFKGAHHTIIHSYDELKPLLVSKYVESDTEDIFPKIGEILKAGNTVLFVGAPCQCAGLYSYLGKDYENLFVVDFLCRGANSPKAHKRYIEYLEKKYNAPISSLRSKDKRNGWEHFGQSAVFANGKEYFADRGEDLRVVAYHHGNLMVRESCLDCKFKELPRYSDLTLGDFWGINAKEVEDIDKGISLIFLNSKKGEKLFEKIGDRIHSIDKTLKAAKAGNPAIYESASAHSNRDLFLRELDEMPFDELVKKYRTYPPKGIKRYIKAGISIVKRIIK